MDAAQIRELTRVVIGIGGFISIYCGYKLFCEIPFGRTRTISIINGLSGAVLALFGMALLVGDVHSISVSPTVQTRQAIRRAKPAEAGSFTVPEAEHGATRDWAI